MKRILVDTNVLLSFVTDRDLRQQAAASELFERAADRALTLVVAQAAIAECVFVLENAYALPVERVAAVCRKLVSLPGVEILDAVAWELLLELWPAVVTDFGDAVLATVAKAERVDALATFDRRFRRTLARLGVETLW